MPSGSKTELTPFDTRIARVLNSEFVAAGS